MSEPRVRECVYCYGDAKYNGDCQGESMFKCAEPYGCGKEFNEDEYNAATGERPF